MSLEEVSTKFNDDTLLEIIKNAGGTELESYKFGESFKKGDSYLSKVFRISVSGKNSANDSPVEAHLIVKSIPESPFRRKIFRSADFFRNEINFYKVVIPIWEDFQKRQNATIPFTEYPKVFGTYIDGENDFIALENVTFKGYGSPKRQDYISLEDCILTMKTLGRFHGVSLALKTLEPENFKKTTEGVEETYYCEKTRNWYKGFLKIACNVSKDAVHKTFPNTKYETIVFNYLNDATLFDDQISLVSKDSKLSVISHGDCWTPNFLTRYSSTNQPEAITVIDFQLARKASLAVDLSFFIYSCTSQELRESHYEELLKVYHESACALIADLGVDPEEIFPWESLLDELKEFGRFGCGMGIESLPMSMLEEEEVADLDSFDENCTLTDVWNLKCFEDEHKCRRIAEMFKHAIDNGYLK